MTLISPRGIIGILLFGYTIISLVSFKLGKETGSSISVKLILSISTGWVSAYMVGSSLLYLRHEVQLQGQAMELTVFASFVAFISFQILLYDLLHGLQRKRAS